MTCKRLDSDLCHHTLLASAVRLPRLTLFLLFHSQNPYCADKSGWTPTDKSLIAAVTLEWGKGRPACGSFLQLRSRTSRARLVTARSH